MVDRFQDYSLSIERIIIWKIYGTYCTVFVNGGEKPQEFASNEWRNLR